MPFICHPMIENIVPSHFQNHSPVAFCGPVRPSSDSPNQLRCLSCSVAAGENGAIRTTHAVILGGIGAPPPRSSIAPSLSQLRPRPRGLLSFARIRDAAFARIRAAPIHDAAFAYIRAAAAFAYVRGLLHLRPVRSASCCWFIMAQAQPNKENVNPSWVPQVGQKCSNLDDAWSFWVNYGGRVGSQRKYQMSLIMKKMLVVYKLKNPWIMLKTAIIPCSSAASQIC